MPVAVLSAEAMAAQLSFDHKSCLLTSSHVCPHKEKVSPPSSLSYPLWHSHTPLPILTSYQAVTACRPPGAAWGSTATLPTAGVRAGLCCRLSAPRHAVTFSNCVETLTPWLFKKLHIHVGMEKLPSPTIWKWFVHHQWYV